MLTDPREALAEQSNFVNGLMGLAGLAHMIHALAEGPRLRVNTAREADDFIYLLLAVASLGEAVRRLGVITAARECPAPHTGPPPSSMSTRWLR